MYMVVIMMLLQNEILAGFALLIHYHRFGLVMVDYYSEEDAYTEVMGTTI